MGDRVANSKSTRKKKGSPSTKRRTKNAGSSAPKAAVKSKVSVSSFKLPAVMDLVAATSLKEEFLGVVEVANGLEVDADDVETIATPCVQILVAAGKVLEAREQSFTINKSSEVLQGAFEDLGLAAEYERWSEAK